MILKEKERKKMKKIQNIWPGVAVIIFNEKKEVLLQKRADVHQWGIPSGHIEIGETVTQAAIREIYEETGLTIVVEKLIGVYSEPASQVFEYPDGRVTHFITTCVQGCIVQGNLEAKCDETLALAFFSRENLPADLLKMHPQWLEDALSEKGPYLR